MKNYTKFIRITILTSLAIHLSITTIAQSKIPSTDVYNIYDFLEDGPLLSQYQTINANNDNLIDFFLGGTSLYLPSKKDDYYLDSWVNGISPFITFKNIPYSIDYNNDGLMDFLVYEQQDYFTYTRNYKGEYIKERQTVMTPAQYAGQRQELILDNYVSPLDQMKDNMMVSGSSNVVGGVPLLTIDLNGDGLSDSYSEETGEMFQTTKEGILVTGSLNGTIKVRDFDGNGLTDYVYYDKETFDNTLHLLNKDGSVTVQKLLNGTCSGGRFWCYDFDHDNDIDILIPVDYAQAYQNSTTGRYGKAIPV